MGALVSGVVLLILQLLNGGRRLFSDPDDDDVRESGEITKELFGSGWLRFFAIFDVFTDKSAVQQSMQVREDRVRRRRAKLDRRSLTPSETDKVSFSGGASEDRTDSSDYWKLPKSGRRVTLLNSAWTWTGLTYLFVLLIAFVTASQNGFAYQGGWIGPAILVALLYPAYRIGTMISRYLKQNAPVVSEADREAAAKNKKAPRPGSVEARMAARRARVARARDEGKL